MSSRWLVGTVCGALLLYAIGAIPPFGSSHESRAAALTSSANALESTQSARRAPERSSPESYAQDYAEFGRQLGEFCAGDGSNQADLERIAKRMADRHGRQDAVQVVEYYAMLRPEDRARGLAAYAEVDGFHERAEGQNAIDWQAARPQLLQDIEQFVARTLPAPEFSAAGNALALASEIRVDWSASRARGRTPIAGGISGSNAAANPKSAGDAAVVERLERAKQDALEAIALFERAGMQTPQLRPLLQLGRLAVLEAREAIARERFEACLQLARDCRRDEYQADALVALIHMARSAGDGPELERRLHELAEIRSPEDSWELAREHAMLWLHRDQAEQAAEFLIRHRPDNAADLRVWRHILTSVRLRMDDLDGAVSLFESLDAPGAERDEDWLLLRSTLDLARDKPQAVLYRLQETRSVVAGFSHRGRSRAEVLLGEAHLMAGEPALALKALVRARTLAESWEARMEEARPNAGTGAAVLGEWLGMHAIVLEAKALCQLDRALEAAVLIERAHGFHWRQEARADRLDEVNAGALGADDLRAWAGAYELGLVTWISGANDGLAIHISPEGLATPFELSLSRRELRRGVRRYRESLLREDPARQHQIGLELTHELLPPSLLEALAVSSDVARNLLLLPHGELERLPFEALPVEQGVLDDVAIVRALPELPTRQPGSSNGEIREWTLLGDPIGTSGEQRLPGARTELDAVHALRPNAIRVSGDALTADVLRHALASGRSLHIATHLAPFDSCASPRFSEMGLELSWGEVLCASAVANEASRADLVVLATCASASGRHLDGRGHQGIARAFLDSGTRNLLVTLWPIRDDIASRFSASYHALLASGAGPATAARDARRHLAADGVAPMDWAAFRALGRD